MKKVIICLLSMVLSVICAVTFVACGNQKEEEPKNTIDMLEYPFYVDEEESMYHFSGSDLYNPYWRGNVIYNETVMLENDGSTLSGKLMYEPIKILSIRDYTWKKEYSVDLFQISGNIITANVDADVPSLTADEMKGNSLPDGYRFNTNISNAETDVVVMAGTIYTEGSLIYGHQISVSYVYDIKDLDKESIPTYNLPKAKNKLKNEKALTIVATGDSVMEGCSTSGHFKHEPFMGTFLEMVKEGLEERYQGSSIEVSNQAKGGMTSAWGCESTQINNLIAKKPDVLYIHFGINDNGAMVSPSIYSENIESIISKVLLELPETEICIIKCFTPNPVSYDVLKFEKYWAKVDDLCKNNENVYSLDMYKFSQNILKTKKYMDVTGNGINHLNDFSARLYSMAMLEGLIDYKGVKL